MRTSIFIKIVLTFILYISFNKTNAQLIIGSEVFGESPIAPNGVTKPILDKNWGVVPSAQSDIGYLDNQQNQNNVNGEVSSDAAGEPPPLPDDPEDIPLDGGTSVLIAIAVGLEYKRRKQQHTTAIKNE